MGGMGARIAIAGVASAALAYHAYADAVVAPDAFEACKAERRRQIAEAMQIADANERGRRLAAAPVCERAADGSLHVDDPRAHPLEPPFKRFASWSLELGLAGAVIQYQVRPSDAFAPVIEGAAAWHFTRAYWVGGFASAIWYDDATYLGQLNTRHRFYDVGARFGIALGDAELGAGIGLELDDGDAFGPSNDPVPARWNELALFDIHAAYRVGHIAGAAMVAGGELTYASLGKQSDVDLSLYGNIASARLTLGVRY